MQFDCLDITSNQQGRLTKILVTESIMKIKRIKTRLFAIGNSRLYNQPYLDWFVLLSSSLFPEEAAGGDDGDGLFQEVWPSEALSHHLHTRNGLQSLL